ncbi:MAG: hypothetical protein GEU90_18165 [Gemmatimonas sp.]|nr:hypothetical protein [Gemmatimonas sp.]
MRKLFGETPANVTLVPVDFDRENLGAALASHGYPASTRTFVILEAVTQYLPTIPVARTWTECGPEALAPRAGQRRPNRRGGNERSRCRRTVDKCVSPSHPRRRRPP